MKSSRHNILDFFKSQSNGKTADAPLERVVCEQLQLKAVPSLPQNLNAPKSSGHVLFSELCEVFDRIDATTKRLEINEILKILFIRLIKDNPEDLATVVHLSLSRLGPAYAGVELGLGETLLIKAIATATGCSTNKIKQDVEEKGDIGLAAEASRLNQRTMFQPKPLTIAAIFKTLHEIATMSGHNSTSRKIDKVRTLFVACQGSESKYLFRLLEGKLRIGLAEQSLLAALANASAEYHGTAEGFDPVLAIKSVYNSLPNYNEIVSALLKYGIRELAKHCHLTPGIPLKPMLAFPTKSITEVLDRFEGLPFTCEFKYDGERAQIHRLTDGSAYIYSRNSENMTQKYPDIIKKIAQISKPDVQSYVLDCEVVAFNPAEQKILPFQILSTRKRKDVTASSIEVEVCIFAFDMLYLNGKSLIEEPFERRRQLLHQSMQDVPGEFHFAHYANPASTEDIQSFLDEAMQGNCEGLMVKTLNQESSYEPSKRSRKWLKVKKDYLDGTGDSLDLVVIGGYLGRGKRTGVYGGYLLACYDPENEEYQAICKIGTGFSEAELEQQASFFKSHVIPAAKPYYRCTDGVKPDVWFEPVQVWEVKAADFSISPVYSAAWGLIEQGKGISLRFPRFIKLREDKGPEDASNSTLIAELYSSQASSTLKEGAFDEDY